MAELSTPQDAVLAIRNAYRDGDTEAVTACKDFLREAILLLSELGATAQVNLSDEIVSATATTLEAAFRAELRQGGFPVQGDSEIVGVEEVAPGLVIVKEEWSARDEPSSSSRTYVGKGDHGWRVLHPVEEPAA